MHIWYHKATKNLLVKNLRSKCITLVVNSSNDIFHSKFQSVNTKISQHRIYLCRWISYT